MKFSPENVLQKPA